MRSGALAAASLGSQYTLGVLVFILAGFLFHSILGHHVPQIKEGSFVTTFLRGTEWAATGEVTIPVPEGFPNQGF